MKTYKEFIEESMKKFKQFMEGGFVKKVGDPISLSDYVKGSSVIDDTETNPLKKRLRLIRMNKSNPLKPQV